MNAQSSKQYLDALAVYKKLKEAGIPLNEFIEAVEEGHIRPFNFDGTQCDDAETAQAVADLMQLASEGYN